MPDRSDSFVVTYRAGDGTRRRLTFERVSDGGYELHEAYQTDRGMWREVGHERVESLNAELVG